MSRLVPGGGEPGRGAVPAAARRRRRRLPAAARCAGAPRRARSGPRPVGAEAGTSTAVPGRPLRPVAPAVAPTDSVAGDGTAAIGPPRSANASTPRKAATACSSTPAAPTPKGRWAPPRAAAAAARRPPAGPLAPGALCSNEACRRPGSPGHLMVADRVTARPSCLAVTMKSAVPASARAPGHRAAAPSAPSSSSTTPRHPHTETTTVVPPARSPFPTALTKGLLVPQTSVHSPHEYSPSRT